MLRTGNVFCIHLKTKTVSHAVDAQVVGTIIRPRQNQTKKYFVYCDMTVFGFHRPKIRGKDTVLWQTTTKILVL